MSTDLRVSGMTAGRKPSPAEASHDGQSFITNTELELVAGKSQNFSPGDMGGGGISLKNSKVDSIS